MFDFGAIIGQKRDHWIYLSARIKLNFLEWNGIILQLKILSHFKYVQKICKFTNVKIVSFFGPA